MNTILTDDEISSMANRLEQQGDTMRQYARAVEAAVLAKLREQEPVAWLYKGDPWFDGNRWQEQAGVTLDKRIAEIRGGIKPLYAAPLPAVVQVPQRMVVTEAMHVAACKVLTRASGMDGLPQRMLDAMLAAAPEAPATAVVQVPQGWKLVPVEPTERMCKAAADAWLDCHSKMVLNKAGAASKAAIAAAPEAPAQEKSNG